MSKYKHIVKCIKCEKEIKLSKIAFDILKEYNSGIDLENYKCICCLNSYIKRKIYYEKIKEKKKKYYMDNKERIKKRNASYFKKHRDRYLRLFKKRYEKEKNLLND